MASVVPEENSSGIFSRASSLFSFGILAGGLLAYASKTYHYHLERWDDAYITFRFARHIAEGYGAIWNIGGERVEGFTSMLHVLVLAAGIKLGIDPWLGSLLISIASVIGTVALILAIVWKQFGRIHPLAAIPVSIYLIDFPTAMHTTSGLETQLFVFLLCAVTYFAFSFIDSHGWGSAIGLGVTVFLASACRPEAVIYGFATYVALAIYDISVARSGAAKDVTMKLAASAGFVAFSGFLYAIWKYNYFGYLLPNPFYVKSSQASLAGLPLVVDFLKHVIWWLAPLMAVALLAYLVASWRSLGITTLLRDPQARAKILLITLPPVLALGYYSTIIHEVGGFFRFSYPTFFYFILGAALLLSLLVQSKTFNRLTEVGLLGVGLVVLGLMVRAQKSWQFAPGEMTDFYIYHSRVAEALRDTGLGSKATILCDAAGVIPYVSGFNQLDRVGLADNYLSGRTPLTMAQREDYIWSRPVDVYIGYEPPALPGTTRPEDDTRMQTPYVDRILMHKKMTRVEPRIMVQDATLLHARMRELRDNWIFLGETDFPGRPIWGLRHFVYVKRNSEFASLLATKLKEVIKVGPDQIDLDDTDAK